MDAGLAWEVVGSIAGVAAVPIAAIIGLSQLRQGRKRDRQLSLEETGGELNNNHALSNYRSPDEAISLMNMRTVAGYRDWSQLRQLAVNIPVAAVLLTWKTVHFIVYKHAYWEKAPIDNDWETEIGAISTRLGADHRTAAVLEDLIDKRNMVAENEPVSRQAALEYIDSDETALRLWLHEEADIGESHKFVDSR